MREIVFYETDEGKKPVENFLDSLTAKQAQKVIWVLKIIEELPTISAIPTTYLKKLTNTDDIWEVRIQLGNDIFRLLGFFDTDDLVILTNGFTKKTQKTPKSEINIAENYKHRYLQRKGEKQNE